MSESETFKISEGQEWVPLKRTGDLGMFGCPICHRHLVIFPAAFAVVSYCIACEQFYSLRQKQVSSK